MTLAYVFWHWRRPGVPAAEYEGSQERFHAALASAPPDGFEGSHRFALSGAAWAHEGLEAYEDWYLVRDSAALEVLNAGAVSASRKPPHDAAAAGAAGGAAGVYALRIGRPLAAARHAHWFGKPDGMSYVDLWALLTPRLKRHGAALWMRFMVLGPTPEFGLRSAGPIELPPELTGPVVPIRPLQPEIAS
ncbi:MAG: hypothetical protein ACRENB_00840 [Gemmatimonadales bacterium]